MSKHHNQRVKSKHGHNVHASQHTDLPKMKHEIVMIPSSSPITTFNSYGLLDFKEKNCILHDIALMYDVQLPSSITAGSGLVVNTPDFNPALFWTTRIEIVFQNNVIDIDEGDYIYFLENDYLHIDNWYQKFLEVIRSNIKFDYISLYDHRDNYNLPFHQNFIQKLRYTDNHIWKKVFSTCASVIVRYDTFKKDISILNMDDFTTFCYLNLLCRDLICPVPGLSTHAMLGFESPGVNWDAVAKRN